jgi:hypothetical protein
MRKRTNQINGIYTTSEEDKLFANALLEAHAYIANTLGLDTPLVYERKHVYGPAAKYLGCYKPSQAVCVFNFSANYGQTLSHALETIGHELRHALQFKLNWYNGHQVKRQRWGKELIGTWKGEEYKGDYHNAPWEVDAREFQARYAEMTHHLFSKEQLETILPAYVVRYPKKVTNN